MAHTVWLIQVTWSTSCRVISSSLLHLTGKQDRCMHGRNLCVCTDRYIRSVTLCWVLSELTKRWCIDGMVSGHFEALFCSETCTAAHTPGCRLTRLPLRSLKSANFPFICLSTAAHLVEAVCTSLRQERPGGRMSQDIILRRPLNQMDIVRQCDVANTKQLLVCCCELPQH